MDPEISALAGAAGTTVVSLLATEAWQSARDGVVAIWRRVHPERAGTVDADLEETRTNVLAARLAGDAEAEQALVGEWQSRLRRLLAADPSLAAELRVLLDELGPPAAESGTAITMSVTASGSSRVIQAARDVHVTEE